MAPAARPSGRPFERRAQAPGELCLEAIYLPPSAKKSPLLRLNIQLEKLRIFWRMVSEKRWISLNQLAFVISKIDEIGRMTGGWIKTLSSK